MAVFIVLIIILILSIHFYLTRNFNYWKNKGIFYIKPIVLVGNLLDVFLMKYSFGEYMAKVYREHPEHRFVGIFLTDTPCLLIRDSELATRILMQDFHYFNKKILEIPKKTDLHGAKSLFSVHSIEWKNSRAKLSPIFTSRKQKVAFDAIVSVGDKIENKFMQVKTIDLRTMASCIASDLISDGVLRRDGQAIYSPEEDPVRELGEQLFSESFNQIARFNMMFMSPKIMKTFNVRLFPKWTYQYMLDFVTQAIDNSTEKNRGDFVDFLVGLREKGSWEGNNGEIIVPDNDTLISQLFMFMTAGYDTLGSGVTFVLYEAARNLDIQEKLRSEIHDVMNKYGGIIPYEGLPELRYTSKFITEVLRKYPPITIIDRTCTTEYLIPGTNITLSKGIQVIIPTLGLQNDEQYYENSDLIIPERFDDQETQKKKSYMSFSLGPRSCLGMRFAMLGLKMALIGALRKHRLSVPKDSSITKTNPKRFGISPLDKITVTIHPLT